VGPAQSELDRLDAAVAGVNRTRGTLLTGAGSLPLAATGLDAADAACATGRSAVAADAREAASGPVAAVPGALAALPEQEAGYRAALDELQQSATPLEPAQRELLARAAAAGRQEAAAVTALREAVGAVWPAYSALDEAQTTWLARASAGWYRGPAEAAAAYALLRRPVLGDLEQARRALQQADATRQSATEQVRAELAAADAALDALRAPAG
jgi:hypothetical protein